MHSNSFFLSLLFNEVIGELQSCFMNLLLKSFFVCISESQDVSCWGCNANSTGATPHTSNESLAWLQQRFPDRLIIHRCDPQWSPHSPDLNPPYFYMWGYLKNRVYGNNPHTIPDLKAAITAAIREITRGECRGVIENFARRIQMCRAGLRGATEAIAPGPPLQGVPPWNLFVLNKILVWKMCVILCCVSIRGPQQQLISLQQGVKLIFTEGHINITVALRGPVVLYGCPQRASCNTINHNHIRYQQGRS